MSRSLVNKLLHQPMIELKAGAGEPDGALLIDAVRRLFALAEDEEMDRVESSARGQTEAAVAQLAAAGPGQTGETK
jgi:hypothetical protein